MIKLGCKGTLLCGGGRLQTWGGIQISSSSPRGRILQALWGHGNDQFNASPRNQASEGYLYLALAWRQRQSIERCHLTTARDTIDGGRGMTKHKLTNCGRHPKKSQMLAQVGRGSLGTVTEEGCTEVRRRSGATGARWVPRIL